MKLSIDDVAQFYQIMWPLRFFVNQRLNILPSCTSLDACVAASPDEMVKVRNALYENAHLFDAFVTENPDRLSVEDLSIVRGWKSFLPGDFLIERYLKKAAIFIGTNKTSGVYAVVGLADSLEEMLYGRRPPIMITKVVLLPFKGHIVYDGFFSLHNVFFGAGIRNDLKESYMAAKQQGRIRWTLEKTPGPQQEKRGRRKPDRDWRPIIDELVSAAQQLQGGQTSVQGPAFNLLKASALLAQAAVHEPDDLVTLLDREKRVIRAIRKFQRTLDRAER
jgi:hypothetical protein